jgi:hypothetical protein
MAAFSFPDPDGASATPPPDGRATSGAARAGGFLPDALRAQPTFFHDVPLFLMRAGSARSLCALKMNGAPRESGGGVSQSALLSGLWAAKPVVLRFEKSVGKSEGRMFRLSHAGGPGYALRSGMTEP